MQQLTAEAGFVDDFCHYGLAITSPLELQMH